MLLCLIKLFKLEDAARDITQPPVQLPITLDGADLSRNMTQVTAGVKINGPCSIDPDSGLPIEVCRIQERSRVENFVSQ